MKIKLFPLFKEFKLLHKYHQQFQVMHIILMIIWILFFYFNLVAFWFFYKALENKDLCSQLENLLDKTEGNENT